MILQLDQFYVCLGERGVEALLCCLFKIVDKKLRWPSWDHKFE